jgi:aspartyl-tRNA(Asn)/glutamyl-tRNA(Gln) amidotransferase subunit C
MAVSLDDVRHVAVLARLGLADDRANALVAELNTILGHMDVLSKVDTSNVDLSTAGASMIAPLEADVGPPVGLVRGPKEFAPSMRDGFLLVPRLATHETAEEG